MNILLVTALLGTVAISQVSVSAWGCERGWVPFCNHCYFFSSDKQSWYQAAFTCASRGGTLVAINSISELKWVKYRAKSLCRGDFWLGGNDIRTERRWVWNPYNILVNRDCVDWDRGQPDNYHGNQDCMLLWARADFRWDDQSCASAKNYICEKFMGSSNICTCRV
ncbi:perlucin-like protein [Pecten maximus]|uniref:perlucin-like protein n=1 Tax=Pecten maximus TaxID=6579 RepID=UPI0014582DF0|nr:perlucin-like protein [Pecten maximus]